MLRADHDLAFLFQFENIAWYEDGKVRILDRRVYPAREEFVTCSTHQEVAQAITDMVTQSYGPFHAAAMGMALAAYECRDKSAAEQKAYLKGAADIIANARPTTARKMRVWTDDSERDAGEAIDAGERVPATRLCRAQSRGFHADTTALTARRGILSRRSRKIPPS